MPGRGTPWRGVGKGVADRIGTQEIDDASITEADLDSALQAKVNAGGGGGETLADVTVGAPTASVDLVLSTPIDLVAGDVGKIEICGYWTLATDIDAEELIIRINGVTTGTNFHTVGYGQNLGTINGISFSGQDHWISQNDTFANIGLKVTLITRQNPDGVITGTWDMLGTQSTGAGQLMLTSAPASITSIQISKRQGAGSGGTIATDSRFWVQTRPF